MTKQKLMDLAIAFIVWMFFMLPIHELFHDFALWLMGFGSESYVKFYFPLWTGMNYLPYEIAQKLLPWQKAVWGLAGGWGVALGYGLLWWRAHVSPTNWDLDDECVLAIVACWQFTRGISEAIGFRDYGFLEIFGVLFPIFLYFPKVWGWIFNEDYIKNWKDLFKGA